MNLLKPTGYVMHKEV